MNEEEKKMLLDFQAFIQYCIEDDRTFSFCISCLTYDINKSTYEKPFEQKTKGFYKYMKEK